MTLGIALRLPPPPNARFSLFGGGCLLRIRNRGIRNALLRDALWRCIPLGKRMLHSVRGPGAWLRPLHRGFYFGVRKTARRAYLDRMFKAFEFCLPTLGKSVPAGPEWFHEIKYDGYRLRVERDGERVRLITRGGYDWTKRYPDRKSVV